MPLIICQKQSFADVFLKKFLKNFMNFTEKHLCWSLFIVKLVKFLRTPFSYNRTLPVVASDLSFIQIQSFKDLIVQFQPCLLLLALRILFKETITRTISSVIARSTNKAFSILFTITTM